VLIYPMYSNSNPRSFILSLEGRTPLQGSLSLFSTPATFNRSNIPTFKRASLWLSFLHLQTAPQQTLSFDILTNARDMGALLPSRAPSSSE
jgi:hypothetical protein